MSMCAQTTSSGSTLGRDRCARQGMRTIADDVLSHRIVGEV